MPASKPAHRPTQYSNGYQRDYGALQAVPKDLGRREWHVAHAHVGESYPNPDAPQALSHNHRL